MKDIVFRNKRIALTQDEKEKLRFKIERILSRIPSGFASYNFSYSDYKNSIEFRLDSLKKYYPGLNFSIENNNKGIILFVD